MGSRDCTDEGGGAESVKMRVGSRICTDEGGVRICTREGEQCNNS